MAQILSVTSDHIDPRTLPTDPATTGTSPAASVYAVYGQPNIDPENPSFGQPTNEKTALTIPAYYSGVRFIAETIAGLPKCVVQKTNIATTRLNHPAEWTLNHEVNPLQTPHTFWTTFLLHAVVWSNAYAAIRRGRAGY